MMLCWKEHQRHGPLREVLLISTLTPCFLTFNLKIMPFISYGKSEYGIIACIELS